MKYLSVCSGIEAATCAWHPLGWEPAGFSEIEKFPSAVLQHHYPDIKNLGNMENYKEWNIERPDLLVGGTPCQSFSVAGLRKGLDDPRGNLALVYLGIAERLRPRWIVWENVPGVLSSYSGPQPPSDLEEGQEWEAEETSDFECFTTALGKIGYGWAYRVLDAQYFGVPQRRRRVFVVGYLGDWRRAAAVLFERESLLRNPPPSREKREDVTGATGESFTPSSHGCNSRGVGSLRSSGGDLGGGSESLVMAHGQGNAEIVSDGDPSLTCNHEAPIVFTQNDAGRDATENLAPTLRSGGDGGLPQQCVAFAQNTRDEVREMKVVGALATNPGMKQTSYLREGMQVRRLTPVECERLQGFPDNYTRIPWRNKAVEDCPDGPRYKALGNSMAVPVMKWLGERIIEVDKIVNPAT